MSIEGTPCMKTLPTAAILLSTLAGSLSAQCFETNFGTLVISGDDSLASDVALDASGFPMAGATYTHVRVNTNGACFLTTGNGGSGTTSTGYSTSASTMLTNMRGAAGASPRIAAYWRDLNLTAANGAGCYVNSTIPGKTVITWDRAVHFGQSTPIFTVQAQLYATGEIQLFWDGETNNTALGATVGISEGNNVADTGPTDLSAGTGVTATGLMYQTFTTLNTFDLKRKIASFVPDGTGGYTQTIGDCVPAFSEVFGAGCGGTSGTAYELFPANTLDLAGSGYRMTPNANGGYDFGPATGSAFTHTVTSLNLGDDTVGQFALPSAFTYPGGSTSTLHICSNGYIWMQPSTTADFSPTVGELFGGGARFCPLWADGVPDGFTGVNNVFAEHDPVTNKVYVSYVNIPVFGGVGGTLDLQCEFDLTSGAFEVRYGANCSSGNTSITGFTPGAGVSSADLGSLDFSARIPSGFSTSAVESPDLTLTAAPAPVIGSSVTWTASGVPAGAATTLMVSILRNETGQPIPFTENCTYYLHIPSFWDNRMMVVAGSQATHTIAIPNNPALAGFPVTMQAAALAPGVNTLGAITSNGVYSVFASF